jgi:hypothetical protein
MLVMKCFSTLMLFHQVGEVIFMGCVSIIFSRVKWVFFGIFLTASGSIKQ